MPLAEVGNFLQIGDTGLPVGTVLMIDPSEHFNAIYTLSSKERWVKLPETYRIEKVKENGENGENGENVESDHYFHVVLLKRKS